MFDALDNPIFLGMYIVANTVSLFMLLAAWRWTRAARWMYVLLFAWASWTNHSTAVNDPQAYLEYADLTWSPLYRGIILGPFAADITRYVELVALCQALIAGGLLLKGLITRVACLGGVLFLLAITPFGIGSGFPSTLLMAAGLVWVMRREAAHWPWPAERAPHPEVTAAVEVGSTEG